jgi:hypothetical protein
MITAKLDVLKIEKSRLYKGQKGTYLDITIIPTPNGKYGDYMIVQSISKEERDKGVKAPILGNGKNIGGGSSGSQRQNNSPAAQSDNTDDLPF